MYDHDTEPFYILSYTENWIEGLSEGFEWNRLSYRLGETPRTSRRYTVRWHTTDLLSGEESVRSMPIMVLPRGSKARPATSVRGQDDTVLGGDAHWLHFQRSIESVSLKHNQVVLVREGSTRSAENDDRRDQYHPDTLGDWEEWCRQDDLNDGRKEQGK